MTTQTAPAKDAWTKPALLNIGGDIGDVRNGSAPGTDAAQSGYSTSVTS